MLTCWSDPEKNRIGSVATTRNNNKTHMVFNRAFFLFLIFQLTANNLNKPTNAFAISNRDRIGKLADALGWSVTKKIFLDTKT